MQNAEVDVGNMRQQSENQSVSVIVTWQFFYTILTMCQLYRQSTGMPDYYENDVTDIFINVAQQFDWNILLL